MSLLRGEEFPAQGETPRVQDTATEETANSKVARRVGGDLPKPVLINAHLAQVNFLSQEIDDQPAREARGQGMGSELLTLHQQALESHAAALVTLGAAEMVPVSLAPTEPARREFAATA